MGNWESIKEELKPKKLDYSVVMIDTWEELEEASQKLFEIKKEDLESVLNKLKSMVPPGCFVLVYDKELNVVAEYDPEEEKEREGERKRGKRERKSELN